MGDDDGKDVVEESVDAEEEVHERSTGKRKLESDEDNESDDDRRPHQQARLIEGEASSATEVLAPRPSVRDVHAMPEVKNRNRRLFGSLMGHLGQAKQNLEKESDRMKRQKEAHQAAADRQLKEFERQNKLKARQNSENKLRQQIASIRKATEDWRKKLEPLSSFLVTEAHPPLTWLPANMNTVTEELLRKRQDMVRICISLEQAVCNFLNFYDQSFFVGSAP